MDTTTTKPASLVAGPGERVCAGYPFLGIDAHVAKLADFASNKAYKDGLRKQCKVHEAVYLKDWRKRRAEAGNPVGKAPAQPKPVVVEDDTPTDPDVSRAAQKAELDALDAAVAQATSVDEAEALLKAAADKAAASRKAAKAEYDRKRRAQQKAAKSAA